MVQDPLYNPHLLDDVREEIQNSRSRFYLERYAEVFQEALTAYMYSRDTNEDPIEFASRAASKMIADMRELEGQLSTPMKPTTVSMQAETSRVEELMDKFGSSKQQLDQRPTRAIDVLKNQAELEATLRGKPPASDR